MTTRGLDSHNMGMTKQIAIVTILLLSVKSYAIDMHACKLGMSLGRSGFNGGFYFISGVSSSLGHCSLFESTRINYEKMYFENYMNENQLMILKEIARGSGDYIDSLGYILGCNSKNISSFKDNVRSEFKSLSPGQPLLPETVKKIAQESGC